MLAWAAFATLLHGNTVSIREHKTIAIFLKARFFFPSFLLDVDLQLSSVNGAFTDVPCALTQTHKMLDAGFWTVCWYEMILYGSTFTSLSTTLHIASGSLKWAVARVRALVFLDVVYACFAAAVVLQSGSRFTDNDFQKCCWDRAVILSVYKAAWPREPWQRFSTFLFFFWLIPRLSECDLFTGSSFPNVNWCSLFQITVESIHL